MVNSIYFLREGGGLVYCLAGRRARRVVLVKLVDSARVSGGGMVNTQVRGLFGNLLDCRACFGTYV